MKLLNSFFTFQIFISDIHYGKREMGSSAKKYKKVENSTAYVEYYLL